MLPVEADKKNVSLQNKNKEDSSINYHINSQTINYESNVSNLVANYEYQNIINNILKCKQNSNEKKNFDFKHYIVNIENINSMNKIIESLNKDFNLNAIILKRIIKNTGSYTRMSYIDCSNKQYNNEIASIKERLRHNLGAKLKKQTLQKNENVIEFDFSESQRNLNILSLNINGISGKMEEFNYLLYNQMPEIFCLQETKYLKSKNLYFPNYDTLQVKGELNYRGLVLGVKKSSGLRITTETVDDDILGIKIKCINDEFFFYNIYRPCEGSERRSVTEKLAKILRKHKEKSQKVIMVGDWNTTPEYLKKHLAYKNAYVAIENVPKRGTRLRTNHRSTTRVIDYGVTNMRGIVVSQKRLRNVYISDHCPIIVTIKAEKPEKSKVLKKTIDRKRLALINKDNLKNSDLLKFDFERNFNGELLHKRIESLIKKENLIKITDLNTCQKVCINKESVRLIQSKWEAGKKLKKKEISIDEYIKIKTDFKKNIYKQRRLKYLAFINKGIELLQNNNSRESWMWIKKHYSTSKKSLSLAPVKKPDGQLESTPDKILEVWKNHFEALAKKEDNHIDFIINKNNNNSMITEMSDEQINWNEIRIVVKQLKNNKAASDDLIPCEFYKLTQDEEVPTSRLAKAILELFQKILETGEMPESWKYCTIVPIHKKGDATDPGNYRGIAIINTLQKVFCKILANRFQAISEVFPLIRKEQTGFVRKEECLGQVASLLEICQRRSNQNLNTFLCFLDLKKAYDLVPHKRLLQKLENKGLGKKCLTFIKNMYENTYIKVRIGNSLFNSFKYERGVRQGCPTSPIIFNMYIDDMLDNMPTTSVPGLRSGVSGLHFADDTVLIASSVEKLIEMMKIVEDWLNINCMELNANKCGIMKIISKPFNEEINISYKGESIPLVSEYTYLGIQFNDELCYKRMAEFRVSKGYTKLEELSPVLFNKKIPLAYKRTLIRNVLIPKLTYGCEIFGMAEQRTLKLKQVLDSALNKLLLKRGFCRRRAYNELKIGSIACSAALARARAITKWHNSDKVIGDLLRNPVPINRKFTWSKLTNTWMKRYNVSRNTQNIREKLNNLVLIYNNREARNDKSKIGEEANRFNYDNSKKLIKLGISKEHHNMEIMAVLRMKCGTFKWTRHYVNALKLGEMYRTRCVCCESETVEDITHLILDCPTFEIERNTLLKIEEIKLSTQLYEESDGYKTKMITQILGEDNPASGQRQANFLENLLRFIHKVLPVRAALIDSKLLR